MIMNQRFLFSHKNPFLVRFDSQNSQKKSVFLFYYYPQFSVRMYRSDKYNKYWVSHMRENHSIFLSGQYVLKELNDIMVTFYHDLIEYERLNPQSLSEKDLIVIKGEILSKSYTFSSMKALSVKVTSDKKLVPEILLSGDDRDIYQNILLSDRDRLVLGTLSLFIETWILPFCIGSLSFYDENNVLVDLNETDYHPRDCILGFLLTSILMTAPSCCIGCYMNLSQFIPYVNRDHLHDRLSEQISSPEIIHLLRSFLNIKILQSMDGRDIYSQNGLLRVGMLTQNLFDFFFKEFEFELRKIGYFCTRVKSEVFIGVPSHFMEKSSVYIIQDSVYNNIKNSLAKIKIPVDALDKLLSCSFIKEGESISLLGGSELRLHNKKFAYISRDNHDL